VTSSDIDFIRFYADLQSPYSATTAAIAILNVQRGYQRFVNEYKTDFTDLPAIEQAALLAAYYRGGARDGCGSASQQFIIAGFCGAISGPWKSEV
jgi:hypothetical protein